MRLCAAAAPMHWLPLRGVKQLVHVMSCRPMPMPSA